MTNRYDGTTETLRLTAPEAEAFRLEIGHWTLKRVIDPELGTNIVDLELVYHAVRNANGINVALTMTTPICRPAR